MRHRVRLADFSGRVFPAFSLLAGFLIVAASVVHPSPAHAASFLPTNTPTDWIVDANWDTNSTPNAVGATAVFANAPTAFQTVNLASDVTVGTLTFNTTGTNPVSLGALNATGGKLIFDAAGAGPVVITSAGTANFGSTGSNTDSLAATMIFNDDVIIDIQNTIAHATTGGLRLGGPITGTGGLTKTGPGLMTWAFTPSQTGLNKDYQGATNLTGGRVRMSSGAAPRFTSSFTINGGQLDPISSSNASYLFGTSTATPLNLNGFGPTTGPFAAFPGVIRPDTNLFINITNNTVLQSDSMLHMQGSASGSLTMSGNMSGKGILYAGATVHDANLGVIHLSGSNSYTGGTIVSAGTLTADASSTNAFGTGSVQVVSANAAFATSQAHIHISSSSNALADSAYLNLAGGNNAGLADDGYADIDGGIDDVIGGLMLGGVILPAGQYGSSFSGAANVALPGFGIDPDEYFTGSGTVTVSSTACAGSVCVPGDYNANGVVNAADFVLWKKGGSLANDFTPGNQASDYDFWRSRFGATTNPGAGSSLANSAVPEPSTIGLVLFAASFLFVHGRRRFVPTT